MKTTASLLAATSLVLLLCLSSTAAQELDLTDSDFESELEKADLALVMFYAPWCGHCKRIKPEFAKSAGDLAKNDPPVTLAKVDCTEAGKDTCGRFDVRGYPTLKIFRNGEFSQEYNGPREAAGITKFMKAQAGPSSKELKTEDDLKAFFDKSEVTVVSFLKDSSEQEAFQKVASSLRETVAFGHYTGSSDRKGVVLHRPTVLQTKLEEAELEFDGKVTKDALTSWINENYHGLVGHRTVDNSNDFKSPLVIAFFEVDYVKNAKGTNYWRNRIMKVAKSHKDLNFAISNKNDFMQEATEFGLSAVGAEKPQVVVKGKDGKKYVMEGDFTVENLESFLDKYSKGEVDAYIKSEAVPKDNDKNPVKVAVAKNFEELVEKSDKDVLVEFYAPWCGHCKKLTPIFDELGEKMTAENVEIVKMDATANDVPSGYDVKGFPTLFWLPKKTKKPEAYNGGRELDDFVKFIAANADSELSGYTRDGKVKKTEL